MSKVIFKLRQDNPNLARIKSGKRSNNYIHYINTQKYASLGRHGEAIFGKVEKLPFDTMKEKDLQKYIIEKTEKGTIMHMALISLEEEDAKRMGLDSRKAWQDYLKYKTWIMAKHLQIPLENLEWVASFHEQSPHPHVHILLWDKNQGIKDYFVHEKTANTIREAYIKDIFANDLSILFDEKNTIEEKIVSETTNELSNTKKDTFGLDSREYKKLKRQLQLDGLIPMDSKIKNPYFKESLQMELFKDLIHLKEIMPATGRLSYGFMPEEVKTHIDSMVDKIIEHSVEISAQFEMYEKNSREIKSYYTTDERELGKSSKLAREKLKRKMGNKLLDLYKEFSIKERNINDHKQMQKQLAQSFLTALLRFLSDENERQYLLNEDYYGELSALAKKELAIKYRDYQQEESQEMDV